jgi:hypothetical protein
MSNSNSIMQTTQTVQAVVEKLATMLSPAAHQGWEVAVKVYQINAINNMVVGVLSLIITLAIGYSPFWWIKRRNKAIKEEKRNIFNPRDESILIPLCLFWVFAFMFSLVPTVTEMLNVWNWVGLWDPQLYAAHEVLQHFTNH